MCRKFWRKIDFNCFYEHSSFAGASGACPAPGGAFAPANVLDPAPGGAFAPAKFFDPAPGGGKAPATFLDPAPGGAFAPAKIFDPAPGGARPCRGLPRTPEFLAFFIEEIEDLFLLGEINPLYF